MSNIGSFTINDGESKMCSNVFGVVTLRNRQRGELANQPAGEAYEPACQISAQSPQTRRPLQPARPSEDPQLGDSFNVRTAVILSLHSE